MIDAKSGVIVMGGEFVTRVTVMTLRKFKREHLKEMAESLPELTFTQALLMLEGSARIIGDNINGFKLEVDEPVCELCGVEHGSPEHCEERG